MIVQLRNPTYVPKFRLPVPKNQKLKAKLLSINTEKNIEAAVAAMTKPVEIPNQMLGSIVQKTRKINDILQTLFLRPQSTLMENTERIEEPSTFLVYNPL